MDIRPPVRATHTYTQGLEGWPAEVFPLLCPVLEAEWVPGWTAPLVLSESGVAELDCVFTTPDPATSPEAEAIWNVLRHDEAAGLVEMLKVTPGFLVVRLTITLAPREGQGCSGTVTYRYTALSPAGEAFVHGRTAVAYAEFMRGWETALNAYLRGRRPAAPAGAAT